MRLNKEMPGHVANRLQAALSREVYYLVAEGVVSAADVDTALSWGPGLRWGVMGSMMLNHLGGGPGGIEHFFQQFTGPMTAWWKTLGSPVLTPEVQKKLIDSVHAEAGSRTIEELEAERDEVLLGLIELRKKVAEFEPNEIDGVRRLRPGATGEIITFLQLVPALQAAATGVPNAHRNRSQQDHRAEAGTRAERRLLSAGRPSHP